MRVIYATSDLKAWVNVAKNMYEQQDWEVIYWITTPQNKKSIQKAFPLTITQGYIDAVRGVYTHISLPKQKKVLDEETLRKYYFHEKTVLKMMDRMDPTAYAFNLSERTELYYEFLVYWINTISVLKPDLVFFTESPHAIFQYILYAVCVESNIKVIRFNPTHIDGLTFLSSSIGETPEYLQQAYKECLESDSVSNYKIADTYLNKNRDSYQNALPYYMRDITQKHSIKETVLEYTSKANRFIKNKIFTAYKRGSNYSLDDNNITKLDLLNYKIKGYFFKKKLKKDYAILSGSVDLTQPYVYVALHYQPEKTTSPEGGIFVDQWLMINMLSASIPKGWKIYVKEHASQFSEKLYGEQGRSSNFYKKVATLDNVQLVLNDLNTFDLIDNAKAIATLTGTVGLEAVIRSRPVLSFGYAWYALCHGVLDIKQVGELEKALTLIEQGYKIEAQKVNAFLYAIEKVSFPVYLNPGNKAGVSFSDEVNIKNLTECLLQYAHQV